jgi:hypothetical protein
MSTETGWSLAKRLTCFEVTVLRIDRVLRTVVVLLIVFRFKQHQLISAASRLDLGTKEAPSGQTRQR